MLAVAVRHLELGIVSIVTATLAALSLPGTCPASAPGMPAPAPEPVAVREKAVSAIGCDEPGIQTVVFTGRVESRGSSFDTLIFQFAEMPRGYAVMTGARGEFEIRVPRSELGIVDLCTLASGKDTAFRDEQLSVEYALQFER